MEQAGQDESTGMETPPARVVVPRGRPKSTSAAERRALIIEHAFAAFVERGFAKTTTELVATRARVSKRAIYDLFPGKAELFAAVVAAHRHLILDLPRPPGEDLPVMDALVRIFRLDMDPQRDREREALLNLIERELATQPALSRVLYDQRVIRSREDLIVWLEEAAVRGGLVVEDPQLCAGLLMDIVFGGLLPKRREPSDAARDRRKQDIVKRLAIVLRGLRP